MLRIPAEYLGARSTFSRQNYNQSVRGSATRQIFRVAEAAEFWEVNSRDQQNKFILFPSLLNSKVIIAKEALHLKKEYWNIIFHEPNSRFTFCGPLNSSRLYKLKYICKLANKLGNK